MLSANSKIRFSYSLPSARGNSFFLVGIEASVSIVQVEQTCLYYCRVPDEVFFTVKHKWTDSQTCRHIWLTQIWTLDICGRLICHILFVWAGSSNDVQMSTKQIVKICLWWARNNGTYLMHESCVIFPKMKYKTYDEQVKKRFRTIFKILLALRTKHIMNTYFSYVSGGLIAQKLSSWHFQPFWAIMGSQIYVKLYLFSLSFVKLNKSFTNLGKQFPSFTSHVFFIILANMMQNICNIEEFSWHLCYGEILKTNHTAGRRSCKIRGIMVLCWQRVTVVEAVALENSSKEIRYFVRGSLISSSFCPVNCNAFSQWCICTSGDQYRAGYLVRPVCRTIR